MKDILRLVHDSPIAGNVSTLSQLIDWKISTVKARHETSMPTVQADLHARLAITVEANPMLSHNPSRFPSEDVDLSQFTF